MPSQKLGIPFGFYIFALIVTGYQLYNDKHAYTMLWSSADQKERFKMNTNDSIAESHDFDHFCASQSVPVMPDWMANAPTYDDFPLDDGLFHADDAMPCDIGQGWQRDHDLLPSVSLQCNDLPEQPQDPKKEKGVIGVVVRGRDAAYSRRWNESPPRHQITYLADEAITGRFVEITRDELVQMAIKHDGLIWIATTGTGKTYTVTNSSGRDVIAVPSIAIAKQVVRNHPDAQLIYGDVSADEFKYSEKYVVVYNSFYRLTSWLGDRANEYVVWIDEAHITAHSFRRKPSRVMMSLAKSRYKTFIGMTATDMGSTMYYFRGVKRAKFTKKRAPISVKVTDEAIEAILKSLDGTVVTHMNNIAVCEVMKARHGGELFNSQQKNTPTYVSLVHHGIIPTNRLWVTSIFDVGLSISHKGKITVVLALESTPNLDPHAIEQIVNRFRDSDSHNQIDQLIIQVAKPKPPKEGETPKRIDTRSVWVVLAEMEKTLAEIEEVVKAKVEFVRTHEASAKARGFSDEAIAAYSQEFLKQVGYYRDENGVFQADIQGQLAVAYESMIKRLTPKQRVEWLTALYDFRDDGFLDLGDDDDARKADNDAKKTARAESKETRKETYERVTELATDGREVVEAIIEDKTGKHTKHEIECASGLLSASRVGHGVKFSDVVKLSKEWGCNSKAKFKKMRLALLAHGIDERVKLGEGTTDIVAKNLAWFKGEVRGYVADYGDEAYLDDQFVGQLTERCREYDAFVAIGHGVGKVGEKNVRKLVKACFKVKKTDRVDEDGKRVQLQQVLNESPIEMDIKHLQPR